MREWVQRQFYYFTEDDSNLLKIRFSTDFVICRDVASEETKKKKQSRPSHQSVCVYRIMMSIYYRNQIIKFIIVQETKSGKICAQIEN